MWYTPYLSLFIIFRIYTLCFYKVCACYTRWRVIVHFHFSHLETIIAMKTKLNNGNKFRDVALYHTHKHTYYFLRVDLKPTASWMILLEILSERWRQQLWSGTLRLPCYTCVCATIQIKHNVNHPLSCTKVAEKTHIQILLTWNLNANFLQRCQN